MTPSVRMPEPPPPAPRSPIFPICSTPTAERDLVHRPTRRAIHASRNAVEPVAQALATFTTGMPVCPISCRMRCPTIAFAWKRQPAASISTSRMPRPASVEREQRRLAAQIGDVAVRVAAEADHAHAGDEDVSHREFLLRPRAGRK